jgi:hypothetical protein
MRFSQRRRERQSFRFSPSLPSHRLDQVRATTGCAWAPVDGGVVAGLIRTATPAGGRSRRMGNAREVLARAGRREMTARLSAARAPHALRRSAALYSGERRMTHLVRLRGAIALDRILAGVARCGVPGGFALNYQPSLKGLGYANDSRRNGRGLTLSSTLSNDRRGKVVSEA